MHYFGIDEAGYGPMLGPLCVAAAGFSLDIDHDPNTTLTQPSLPNLWDILGNAVCRTRRDPQRRIAIDESKKLKGARTAKMHPLTHLERGVLSFAAVRKELPKTDSSLFKQLGADVQQQPWYDNELSLPISQDAGLLKISGGKLNRALESAGVDYLGTVCEIIDAASFNKQVERTGRKSSVNLSAAMRLVDRIWRTWDAAHIVLDRQGGKMRYRADLQQCWPEAQVTVCDESPKCSSYQLCRGQHQLWLSFQVSAEDQHLPVALASMTAKYTRELLMERLNGYFGQHLPDLRPTAGYVQDARRYLQDIDPIIQERHIDRSQLVRSC